MPIILTRVPSNLEIVCSDSENFLGYRGRPLPLPEGWRTWNAVASDGRLVGSLTVSVGPADHIDWEEADYDGPFFRDDGTGELIAAFHCVWIDPKLRSSGLWQQYEEILGSLGLPVYATFANERLRDRFMRLHRPLEHTRPTC